MFSKIYPLCCHGNQSNSTIWTKFIRIVQDYSRNISVKKKKSKYLQWGSKNCQFPLSHYKSMETISCHSNHSSYPIGTKTILFLPPTYRCYVWNMARIIFMASEEMLFENVDDGWWRRMPAYTISSPMSLQLRWAKTYITPTYFVCRGYNNKSIALATKPYNTQDMVHKTTKTDDTADQTTKNCINR